ncbi:hypothetical protein BT93_C0920 [Corymbia citriodora subsp. variegata]|nr:hypothetical protein BT93_C0920 [Corymbia citriodora subsp. variegata]
MGRYFLGALLIRPFTQQRNWGEKKLRLGATRVIQNTNQLKMNNKYGLHLSIAIRVCYEFLLCMNGACARFAGGKGNIKQAGAKIIVFSHVLNSWGMNFCLLSSKHSLPSSSSD